MFSCTYVKRLSAATLLMFMLFAGCESAATAHRVNGDLARQILADVLQGWRDGGKPEDWKSKTPSVVVQDMEWMTGHKLIDFEILEEGELIDANLHCQVKLTIADANQATQVKTVTYLVGTSPVCTVFRSLTP